MFCREKEIDDFKDAFWRERGKMTREEIDANVEAFISMVNEYKEDFPSHVKCVERWRKWWKTVYKDRYKKPIPLEERYVLLYHLETFRVGEKETAFRKLNNWINRMVLSDYTFDDETLRRIESIIMRYGYELQVINEIPLIIPKRT